MSSHNSVTLVGNLGKDPEIRSFASGDRVASFSLATSETWKDKSTGERKEKTQWHNISVMNDRTVDVVERFLKKGSKVLVQGSIEYRKFTDKQGNERYSTDIVISRFKGELTMLDSKNAGVSESPRVAEPRRAPAAPPSASVDFADEIPF